MPVIATGVQYREPLLKAARAAADEVGAHSAATIVTPALVALSDADLLRLASLSGERDVYYDGSVMWIHGVDFSVCR